jgi:hypothetical protein
MNPTDANLHLIFTVLLSFVACVFVSAKLQSSHLSSSVIVQGMPPVFWMLTCLRFLPPGGSLDIVGSGGKKIDDDILSTPAGVCQTSFSKLKASLRLGSSSWNA